MLKDSSIHHNEHQLAELKQQMESMQSKMNVFEVENSQHKRRVAELQNENQRLQNDRVCTMNDLEAARRVRGKTDHPIFYKTFHWLLKWDSTHQPKIFYSTVHD